MDEYAASGRKLQFEVIQAEDDSLARGKDQYSQIGRAHV